MPFRVAENAGSGQMGVTMSAMRKRWFLAGIVMLMAACINSKPPLAPTAIAEPTPPLATPPLPTTVPGVLAVAMPDRAG